MRGKGVVGSTGTVAGLFRVRALSEEVFLMLLGEDLADGIAGWGSSGGFLGEGVEGG